MVVSSGGGGGGVFGDEGEVGGRRRPLATGDEVRRSNGRLAGIVSPRPWSFCYSDVVERIEVRAFTELYEAKTEGNTRAQLSELQ